MGALASGWLKQVFPGASPRERLERALKGGWKEVLLDPQGAEGEREWTGMIQEIRGGPLKVAAVQAGPLPFLSGDPPFGPGREGPASPSPEGREVAWGEVSRALDLARRAGCPRILVRPGILPVSHGWDGDLAGSWEDLESKRARVEAWRKESRDQALDRVCRFLHQFWKEAGGAVLCLRNGFDLAGLDRPEDLEALVEDLGPGRVRVWVDAGAATARELAGDGSLGALLEKTASYLEGVSVGDVRPGEAGLLPGTGRLDLPLLGDYLGAPGFSRPWALEIGPSFGWEAVELAGKELEGL